MFDWLYITRSRAKEAGLTHEGTLFGVSAWFAGGGHDEIVMATPKVPALHAWCWLADRCFDIAAMFTPSHMTLESPITVKRRI